MRTWTLALSNSLLDDCFNSMAWPDGTFVQEALARLPRHRKPAQHRADVKMVCNRPERTFV